MPPKRNATTRSTAPARRGRSSARGRGRGGKNSTEHTRVLSDIIEESVAQLRTEQQTPKGPTSQQRPTPVSKKRAFEDDEQIVPPPKRETRAQAAKKAKHHHVVDEKVVSNQTSHTGLDQAAHVEDPETSAEPAASHIPDVYISSLNLLFFVHLAELDTDSDTESITLNLINLTLADSNWHGGLSGLVQPVACFLIASLLTRKQNLVEDVAASVEMFGLDYQQLVEGYRLLWEWRDNMSGAVGAYAERLAELPDPGLLLGQGEYGSKDVSIHEFGEETNDRPEPERWAQPVEA
jgi:hypothetical protein